MRSWIENDIELFSDMETQDLCDLTTKKKKEKYAKILRVTEIIKSGNVRSQ